MSASTFSISDIFTITFFFIRDDLFLKCSDFQKAKKT